MKLQYENTISFFSAFRDISAILFKQQFYVPVLILLAIQRESSGIFTTTQQSERSNGARKNLISLNRSNVNTLLCL